jgi:hypothetical protein
MTTTLQTEMLKAIARDELTPVNGAEPESRHDAETFADCVIETAVDKGTFTSLLNAGLVWHSGKGRDAVVGLTDAGFDAYKALN